MAITHLEQKHVKKLIKMFLSYKGKKKIKTLQYYLVCIFVSYFDDIKLFFSASRFELIHCDKYG